MVESRDRLMLPWSTEARESRFFNAVLGVLLLLMLVLSVWVPLVHLPEPDREVLEKLPPQLAKLVVPKEQPKPESKQEKLEPEKEEVKPEEPKKEEPKKDEPKPKPEPKKEQPRRVEMPKEPPKQTVTQAREVAEKKMQTLMDDLADMRSSVDMSALKKDVKPRAESTIAAKAGAISSSKAVARSGGIDTGALASVSAEKVRLAQHQGTQLTETNKEKALAQAETEAALQSHIRSNESIQLAAEKIKGSFNTHYLRELRKNPFLEGKVVLEVVIEPGGEVSACRLVSSELGHKELEAKFVSLMKLFNFGAEDVAQRTVNMPFTFKPS